MSHHKPVERFHALDATRAFALLLGVAFHAAWSFVPKYTGGPIVDVSGHPLASWFFFAEHTFRMQLFFLIAGFFARMLYQKRGLGGFFRNRFNRITVPLLLAWPLIVVLGAVAWVWGGNVSSSNLIPVPLLPMVREMFTKGLIFVSYEQGGMFDLAHLWFLYYLLLLYVSFLLLRSALVRVLPTSTSLRIDSWVNFSVTPPWALLLLTVPAGLLLWQMNGWGGSDTPTGTLVPEWQVLALYLVFFGLGWLLHRQAALLQEFARHWKWQMIVGLALTVPLYFAFQRLTGVGAADVEWYPSLSPGQVIHWPRFLVMVQSGASTQGASPALSNLWQHLPAAERGVISRMTADARPDAQAGVCNELNKILGAPDLFTAGAQHSTNTPPAAEMGAYRLKNRKTLEEALGTITQDPRQKTWYQPVKLLFGLAYALTMWLLVFATLGFFQQAFAHHSAGVRYVADSAYWIYLAHMPLVPFLQVWIANWQFPGLLKYAFLNLVAFSVLFLTYHLFVRSTVLGSLLNGQRHPFSWRLSPAGPIYPGPVATAVSETRSIAPRAS